MRQMRRKNVVRRRTGFMKKWWNVPALCGLVLVAAACTDDTNDEDVVARVGKYEFTVDQAVGLLVDEERLAADVGVVQSLAELWVDYTLLAEAAYRDTTFSELDFEPLVTQQLSQAMVFQLRDSVIQVDTFITEDELRAKYESEAPEMQVRARHIMLQLPFQATQAQRDSVVARLRDLRQRIVDGASFEILATRFSQDPGSARVGGDLGFFARGDMVAPFEEAAFALEPGQMSDVVESPMGLHLIRVEERRMRGFEEAEAEFRSQLQGRMVAEAESLFVAGLVERADPQLAEGAIEVTRELAKNADTRLSGRAGRRALVEWDGGAITVGEVQEVLQLESEALRAQLNTSPDEAIVAFLEGLGRRDLLIREAEDSGLRPTQDTFDALIVNAAERLRSAARALGLLDLDPAPGEKVEVAIARAVDKALMGNLTGATQIVPLGIVGFQLREGTSSAVLEAGAGRVIVEIARTRAGRSLSPLEETLDSALASPDTIGR
jgi:peptidyl-prolyl cis-trans isomerase C